MEHRGCGIGGSGSVASIPVEELFGLGLGATLKSARWPWRSTGGLRGLTLFVAAAAPAYQWGRIHASDVTKRVSLG